VIKFKDFLLLVFGLNLLISLMFIITPSFLKGTTFSKRYNTYILPGPFFKDDRITTTYSYTLSYKSGRKWTAPVDESKEYLNKYYEDFNPSDLYISRYTKAKVEQIFWDGFSNGKVEQFHQLSSPIFKQIVPAKADSIRITSLKENVSRLSIQVDTITNPIK